MVAEFCANAETREPQFVSLDDFTELFPSSPASGRKPPGVLMLSRLSTVFQMSCCLLRKREDGTTRVAATHLHESEEVGRVNIENMPWAVPFGELLLRPETGRFAAVPEDFDSSMTGRGIDRYVLIAVPSPPGDIIMLFNGPSDGVMLTRAHYYLIRLLLLMEALRTGVRDLGTLEELGRACQALFYGRSASPATKTTLLCLALGNSSRVGRKKKTREAMEDCFSPNWEHGLLPTLEREPDEWPMERRAVVSRACRLLGQVRLAERVLGMNRRHISRMMANLIEGALECPDGRKREAALRGHMAALFTSDWENNLAAKFRTEETDWTARERAVLSAACKALGRTRLADQILSAFCPEDHHDEE